jgi:hypothetical protein
MRRLGAADCGWQAAGAVVQDSIAIRLSDWMTDAALSGTAVEKYELSKIHFEMIDEAVKALRSPVPIQWGRQIVGLIARSSRCTRASPLSPVP